MSDPVIELFAPASSPPSKSWELLEGTKRVEKTSIEEFVTASGAEPSRRLLDLSGLSGLLSNGEVSLIRGFTDQGGTVLVDPWKDNTAGLIDQVSIVSGRVVLFTPVLYDPPILECHRILAGKVLGEIAGIEVLAAASVGRRNALFAACVLFGVPTGINSGAGSPEGDFLWYKRLGCMVRYSGDGEDRLSVRAACKQGQVMAVAGHSRMVVIQPAGKKSYRLPLPEGDGIYYNRKDTLDCVLKRNNSNAYQVSRIMDAYLWVRERVNEGT